MCRKCPQTVSWGQFWCSKVLQTTRSWFFLNEEFGPVFFSLALTHSVDEVKNSSISCWRGSVERQLDGLIPPSWTWQRVLKTLAENSSSLFSHHFRKNNKYVILVSNGSGSVWNVYVLDKQATENIFYFLYYFEAGSSLGSERQKVPANVGAAVWPLSDAAWVQPSTPTLSVVGWRAVGGKSDSWGRMFESRLSGSEVRCQTHVLWASEDGSSRKKNNICLKATVELISSWAQWKRLD